MTPAIEQNVLTAFDLLGKRQRLLQQPLRPMQRRVAEDATDRSWATVHSLCTSWTLYQLISGNGGPKDEICSDFGHL